MFLQQAIFDMRQLNCSDNQPIHFFTQYFFGEEDNDNIATNSNSNGTHHAQVTLQKEKAMFFSHTLPFMQSLALKLPSMVTDAIPVLIPSISQSVALSRVQVAAILVHAFFCVFDTYDAVRVRQCVS
jgi:hypothetical protein